MTVSSNYRKLTVKQVMNVAPRLQNAWKNAEIPRLQRSLVAGELEQYRRGEQIAPFDALHAVLRHISVADVVPTLLDVGASSGHYKEVLQLRGFDCIYRAADYSENFKKLAEFLYHDIEFDVCDAINLPYLDESFDIVLSSGCILHVLDYGEAISEAVRVAKKYVIFHRTPVAGRTTYFEKLAYGVPCLEIHFSQDELFEIFDGLNLDFVTSVVIAGTNQKTYLFEKQ